jgi:glutathione S-transferase
MELVAMIAGLALLEYVYFGVRVAQARQKFGVDAPAITGHPEFERNFRVQQNTLEQLVIFIPAIFLFGYFVSAPLGALLGLVFVIGRLMYQMGYVQAADKRGTGFLISEVANLLLLVGGIIGAGVAWF